jgi:hypothetical protein
MALVGSGGERLALVLIEDARAAKLRSSCATGEPRIWERAHRYLPSLRRADALDYLDASLAFECHETQGPTLATPNDT